jgi:tRNA/rRNA methyltransferase
MTLKFPVIILASPQLGENIGSAARLMSNFGFSELRIVAPRDGWPNEKAIELSAKGINIVNNAKVFANFAICDFLPKKRSG